jgi:UDP-N-acetylmuramoylalanine--D-glutamate ligase
VDLKGRRITVVGLGLSGTALVKWLAVRGALVGVSEAKPEAEFASWLILNRVHLERTEFGGHTEAFLCSSDLIIASPGVPATQPALAAAARRGVPVIGELEVVLSDCRAKVAAVTGTNGKTTTTALLGHLLKSGGVPSTVAGNIGIPVSQVADSVGAGHVLVLEVSSFQLDTAPSLHPDVALLLNVTPDHLDRYPSFTEYARSKERIFANQTEEDVAVLNRRDAFCAALAPSLVARVRWFDARDGSVEGAGILEGWLVLRDGGREKRIIKTTDLPMRGEHNLENAMAACVAAASLGVRELDMAEGLRSFPGVEHRLEAAGSVGQVVFINDSKATNVDAQEKALQSFDEAVVLIAGGRDKGADFTRLLPLLKKSVKEAVLVGEAAAKIRAAWEGTVPLRDVGSLDEAVATAYEIARPKGLVLLSPGCASFDMFQNFEERGRKFREAVSRLSSKLSQGEAA